MGAIQTWVFIQIWVSIIVTCVSIPDCPSWHGWPFITGCPSCLVDTNVWNWTAYSGLVSVWYTQHLSLLVPSHFRQPFSMVPASRMYSGDVNWPILLFCKHDLVPTPPPPFIYIFLLFQLKSFNQTFYQNLIISSVVPSGYAEYVLRTILKDVRHYSYFIPRGFKEGDTKLSRTWFFLSVSFKKLDNYSSINQP